MTISIKVSVNGSYKCPVSYRQGDREESVVISGRGLDHPNELNIPFQHGAEIMSLSVGPEEQDTGEEAQSQ